MEIRYRRLERGSCVWKPLRGFDGTRTPAKPLETRGPGQDNQDRLTCLYDGVICLESRISPVDGKKKLREQRLVLNLSNV